MAWAVVNLLPVLFLLAILVFGMRRVGRLYKTVSEKAERQNQLLEQQAAVLRETNELLKKLNESPK
jgi:uncharacterized protein YoxC